MKCGTTSIHRALQAKYPWEMVPHGMNHRHAVVESDPRFDESTFLLSTRNPVSRVLSMWSQLVKYRDIWEQRTPSQRRNSPHPAYWVKLFAGISSLEDYLAISDNHPVSQEMAGWWRVSHQLKAIKSGRPDFVIRQEHLAEDLNAAFDYLHIPRLELQRLNESTVKFTAEHESVAQDIALRWWSEDFAIGNYSADMAVCGESK